MQINLTPGKTQSTEEVIITYERIKSAANAVFQQENDEKMAKMRIFFQKNLKQQEIACHSFLILAGYWRRGIVAT